MTKREGEFKAALIALVPTLLGREFIALLHQDVRKRGIPDVTINGNGITTWWELKHGTPDFDAPGLQVHVCKRLAKASFCRFLIYQDLDDGSQRTVILHPNSLREFQATNKLPRNEWSLETHGHNHEWVIDIMRLVHEPQ